MASTTAKEIGDKWVAAYNSGDAASVADLFTAVGVFTAWVGRVEGSRYVGGKYTFKGREAIKKAIADLMSAGWIEPRIGVSEAHEVSNNVIWAIGDYGFGSRGDYFLELAGTFAEVLVRDADTWHIAVLHESSEPPAHGSD
jgi:ketosteroid isomerase-like protein